MKAFASWGITLPVCSSGPRYAPAGSRVGPGRDVGNDGCGRGGGGKGRSGNGVVVGRTVQIAETDVEGAEASDGDRAADLHRGGGDPADVGSVVGWNGVREVGDEGIELEDLSRARLPRVAR